MSGAVVSARRRGGKGGNTRCGQADNHLPEADRERFAERYAAKAVELLDRAADHHYFDSASNRERLRSDADLAALHDRADFRALLAKLGIPAPRREDAAPRK